MGLHPCIRLITDGIDEKHAGKSWSVNAYHAARVDRIRPGSAFLARIFKA